MAFTVVREENVYARYIKVRANARHVLAAWHASIARRL
jgi:hypothetical protein